MKKFAFSLGRILDYRQSVLEREKNNLMALFGRRHALEDRLEAYRAQHAQAAQERTDAAMQGTTAVKLQQVELRIQAAKRSIEQCERDLAQLDQVIDKQREVVKTASQDVTGLEKLRDKQRETYDYEQRQEEQERIAELISTKLAGGENPQEQGL